MSHDCKTHSFSRRGFLSDVGMGFTGMALASMLHGDGVAKPLDAGANVGIHGGGPLGQPHFAPKAKRVIWLMMRGGVSHFESFDPKPVLSRYAGKTISETPYEEHVTNSPFANNLREQIANNVIKTNQAKIWPMQVGYEHCGRSGVGITDWFPHLKRCADEIAVIRSMWTTDNNHGAQVQLLSGRHLLDGCFPTIGAWIHYGLGTLNDNLPQFISIGPPISRQCFEGLGSGYLGPEHAGVRLRVDPDDPLAYAKPELDVGPDEQEIRAALLGKLNRLTAVEYPNDPALRARIQSYELAFRMQRVVPGLLRFDSESEPTRRLYGLDEDITRPFGQQLLATRRLAEQGVRFIQVFHGEGGSGEWDGHSKFVETHKKAAAKVDRPIAGLIKDLKQRGLLEETILLWTTEFGRTPGVQGADGRDHHNYGFSIWMAGGGVKPGVVHGATDEIGFHAVEDRHYVTDIHATVFQLLGLDPRRLEIPGRKRLAIDYGNPITDIMV
ncbi:MAG: DUF1501 domain-containing protein [Planctomycetes bacterium]|nr:DUF1501 domain-containing protein [Planctomycetota bacterium]